MEELVIADSVKLVKDTYVDDGSTGGSPLDVDRMMGPFSPSLGQFSGTIQSMSAKVGLRLKTMVRSGSTDTAAIKQLGSGVLGYKWDPTADLMSVKIKFNTSKHRKGLRTKPDLTSSDLGSLRSTPFNRHVLLSICNGIYDPLGIASPIFN